MENISIDCRKIRKKINENFGLVTIFLFQSGFGSLKNFFFFAWFLFSLKLRCKYYYVFELLSLFSSSIGVGLLFIVDAHAHITFLWRLSSHSDQQSNVFSSSFLPLLFFRPSHLLRQALRVSFTTWASSPIESVSTASRFPSCPVVGFFSFWPLVLLEIAREIRNVYTILMIKLPKKAIKIYKLRSVFLSIQGSIWTQLKVIGRNWMLIFYRDRLK